METFILIVMLCTVDPDSREYCITLAEEPKVYYTSEKNCNINSLLKKKQILKIAKEFDIRVSGIYSNCIISDNPARVPIFFFPYASLNDGRVF
jgi:hypothetical protein